MTVLRVAAVLLFLSCAAAAAETPDPGPLPDPVPVDGAGFREDVLGFLKPVIGSDIVSFGDDFVLKLTSPVNGQRVELNLGAGHRYCVDHPKDCRDEVMVLYKQFRRELQAARSARDKREADDDSVEIVDASGTLTTLVKRSAASVAHTLIPAPGVGTPGALPLDDDGFTAYVRQKVQLYTSNEVTGAGSSYMLTLGRPLGFTIVYPSGGTKTYSLTDLRGACLTAPAGCDSAVDDFVQETARSLQEQQVDLARLRIHLSLKATRYSPLRMGSASKTYMMADVAEAAFGNFYEVCFENESDRLIQPQLLNLGLSPREAIARCEDNTRAALGPADAAYRAALPADGIGMVMGSSFESARLIFVDDWASLANSLGGLLVSAPAQRMIVYSRDGGPAAAQALRDRARSVKSEAGENALSASVFRWTKNGWVTVIDDD